MLYFPGMEPVYLDNHLLVIHKPAGLLSQADRTGDEDVVTLWKGFLKDRFNKPGNVFLGLVHRLDRPASGLMVLARTSKAAERLFHQFKNREAEKIYLALVEGCLEGTGSFEDFLLKEDGRVRIARASEDGARDARLDWSAVMSHDGLTLVSIRLLTGRSHQIRVQFASRGYSLVGDMRYGATRELDGQNLALHATRLGIIHPTRKEPMVWEAPVPETWPELFR